MLEDFGSGVKETGWEDLMISQCTNAFDKQGGVVVHFWCRWTCIWTWERTQGCLVEECIGRKLVLVESVLNVVVDLDSKSRRLNDGVVAGKLAQ